MDEKEIAQAKLNAQIVRNGGLQRAGMRKVQITWFRSREQDTRDPFDPTRWELIADDKKYDFITLVSLFPLYFHCFISEIDKNMRQTNTFAVLEYEDGTVMSWNFQYIKFIS